MAGNRFPFFMFTYAMIGQSDYVTIQPRNYLTT